MKHMYIKAFAWETFTWSFYLSRTYLMHRCTIGQPDWPRTSILKVVSYGHRSKLFLNKFLFFYSYLSCQKSPWEGIPQKQQHQISLSFGPQSTFGNATIDQCTTSGRSSSRFHRQAHKICHSERLINVISPSFHSHLSMECLVWVRASAATVWETISTFPHCSYRHRRLSYFTPCLQ